jgi:NTE family protein
MRAGLVSTSKSDPNAQKLAAACDERSWLIIRLINTRPSRSGLVKDYEFSRATIEDAWAAGLEDVRRSISGWDTIKPYEAGPEIVIYRPTEALPLLNQAAE